MPEFEIRGRLTGLIAADLSGPADEAAIARFVAELPDARLIKRTPEFCDLTFRIGAVDASDASTRGFDIPCRFSVVKRTFTGLFWWQMPHDVDASDACWLATTLNCLAELIDPERGPHALMLTEGQFQVMSDPPTSGPDRRGFAQRLRLIADRIESELPGDAPQVSPTRRHSL